MQRKKVVSFLLAFFLTLQVLSGSLFAAENETFRTDWSKAAALPMTKLLSKSNDLVRPSDDFSTVADKLNDLSSGVAPSVASDSALPPSVIENVHLKQPLPEKPSPSLELIDERTPNSKTYQLEDGTYETVISTEALHYQDRIGNWQDIELMLTDEADIAKQSEIPLSNDALPELNLPLAKDSAARLNLAKQLAKLPKDAYRALQAPFDVRIGKQFTQGYEIGKGADRLSFIPVDANPSKAVVKQDVYGSSLIRYPSAWESTYVDLQLLTDGIKETIVLDSPSAPSTFSYEVTGEISKDLRLGDLQIEPAWLVDAAGTYREVSQTLRSTGGTTFLDLQPDLGGLEYPVTIDPTVVLWPENNNDMKDTTLNAHEPNRNYNSDPRLYTGKDTNGNQFRTLLYFNLGYLPPGEYNVLDAYITLNQTAENQYNSNTQVQVQRITNSWDASTVTWNTQPSYSSNVEGNPYGAAYVSGEGVQIFYLKGLVSEWVNGLYPNYGVELHADSVTAPNVKKFVSSNTSIPANHPSITLRYTMPNQTWNGTSSSVDALTSFNQKKLDYTSDGYKWLLVRDGGDFRLDGMKPDDSSWFHSGTKRLDAENGSMYIDQDNYLHLAYKAVGGGIKYVRGTYNSVTHRWNLSTPVVVSTDATVNYPDLVAHRALSGGGWNVHIVSSKHSEPAGTNGTLYNQIDISSSGVVGAPGTTAVLDSGTTGVPTWPSIDFRHTPSSVSNGKEIKDNSPALYVSWNAGAAGAGLGIRYMEAAYSAGSWTWAAEQAVDENQYTTSQRDWFLSVYDGSRAVVFGSLRNLADHKSILAYTMQSGSKRLDMFYSNLPVGKQVLFGSGSYDAQGNLYFGGNGGAASDINNNPITFKWSRATKALSLPTMLNYRLRDTFLTMKRGDSYNKIELATSTQSWTNDAVYEIEHSLILDTIERQFTQYSYDAASRLKYIRMQSGDGIEFTYDTAGNLTRRELDPQPDTNGTNLLINGGFEVTEHTPGVETGAPDPNYGWQTHLNPDTSFSDYTPVSSPSPVSRGNSAYKLRSHWFTSPEYIYQTIEVNDNRPFSLSGKIFRAKMTESSAVLGVEFLSEDNTSLGSYDINVENSMTTYTTLMKKGWIPKGTVNAKVHVKLNPLGEYASTEIFADEIKLEYAESNELWNPGFERTKNGQTIDWNTYVPGGATSTFLPVSEAYEGAYGLKVTASGLASGAYTFVHQTQGIGAGESYNVSTAYMTDNLSGAVGVLALQFFNESGASVGWVEQTGTGTGSYNNLSLSGIAPSNAVYIKVMAGLKGTAAGGQGNVYVDDVNLKITQ
ncbi:DNRLRE domain-containing protein [Paenibacillus sp. FSL M7-0420]|uniref:DNRLRE domain-containing protein n=1 Tax=Paenibacillus sp. FSL M7-0420 TaxID=2921609 RepID=UPI0030F6FA13